MEGIASSMPPATPTRITSLSEDLLLKIIEDDCISHQDVVALRLTCAALSKAAAAVLFHRIRISQLCHDRDNFLSVCRSPHLAQHVREVEWQEVSWSPGYFCNVARPHRDTCNVPLHTEDGTQEICETLDDLAAGLFWLPTVPYELPNLDGESTETGRQMAITQFRHEFDLALSLLPYLHTFISRPMPHERALHWCEYPISVKLFNSHHLDLLPKVCPWPSQINDGFFLFLLPAIERATPPVTRLLWEDQFPGASYLCPPRPEAFQRLDTLSISFIPDNRSNFDNLAANLEAATSIRHLSIALQYSPHHEEFSKLQSTLLRASPAGDSTAWSRLHSLRLDSMPQVAKVLFVLVESNADTLRHLYFCDCFLRLSVVQKLAEIPDLRLDSLRIVQNKDSREETISEEALLRFVNESMDDGSMVLPVRSKSSYKRIIATTDWDRGSKYDRQETDDKETDDEKESVCSDATSEDSLDCRLRTGPKWVWGRYFHGGPCGEVYAYPVSDSHPHGHSTQVWRFTSRDGKVGLGRDPLEWFEDWDPEAGDVEEPMPYCRELHEFVQEYEAGRGDIISLDHYLGAASSAWELLRTLEPPEGAVKYDEDEVQRLPIEYF